MAPDRIRVLYVIEDTVFGGGERGFGQLAAGLNRDRFKTHLAAHPGGRLETLARSHDIPFFPLDMSRKFNLKTISKLSNLLRAREIQIIHSMGSRSDFYARVAGHQANVPAIVSTMAMLIEGYDIGAIRKLIYGWVDGLTEKWTDQFIAVSNALEKMLVEDHGIPRSKVRTIYNGVELGRYSNDKGPDLSIREKLGIPPDAPVVGMIGRFVYQKGYGTFIEAASRIVKSFPEARYLMVGDGPLKADMENLSGKLNFTGRCIFAGEQSDIPNLLSIMDIVVQPSIIEGLPRVIIEAMAMARPIVASDIPGIREQIENGRTGLLVPPGDPGALAEAVLTLLKDKIRAENLGSAARKSAEQRFDLTRQLALYEEMYLEVLAKKGLRP